MSKISAIFPTGYQPGSGSGKLGWASGLVRFEVGLFRAGFAFSPCFAVFFFGWIRFRAMGISYDLSINQCPVHSFRACKKWPFPARISPKLPGKNLKIRVGCGLFYS
jgi:hypothetical protein